MKKWFPAIAVLALLGLAGCAAGPGGNWAPPDAEPAGFFWGLWHGALMFVTLVVSFFTNDVRIYEVHNAGIAYDIGFVLGVLAVYGSGFRITVRKKSRRDRAAEDDIGKKVEAEVKRRVSRMLDEDDRKTADG